MAGFIYIMSNPSFIVGRVKIGKSDRDPMEFRKYELETTGVPEPFKVEYFAFVDDHHSVEKAVHAALEACRGNKLREFFDISVSEAVSIIRGNAKVHFERSFYSTPKQTPKQTVYKGWEQRARRQKIDDALALLAKVQSSVDAKRNSEEAEIPETVEILCDSCGQRLSVPKYRRGNVRCPKCGREWKDFLFR
jgi:hypothetical protein